MHSARDHLEQKLLTPGQLPLVFWVTPLLFSCPPRSGISIVSTTMTLQPYGVLWETRSLLPVFVPLMTEAYT